MPLQVVVVHSGEPARAAAILEGGALPPGTAVHSFAHTTSALFAHDASLSAFVAEKERLHGANAQEAVLEWPREIACARVQAFVAAMHTQYFGPRGAALPFYASRWAHPRVPLVPPASGPTHMVLVTDIDELDGDVRRYLVESLVVMSTAAGGGAVQHAMWYGDTEESRATAEQTGTSVLSVGNVHLLLQVHDCAHLVAWLTGDTLPSDNALWDDSALDMVHDSASYRGRCDPMLAEWCATTDAYTQIAVVHAIRTLTGIPRDFCGAQPCNMSQKNATLLRERAYVCALKVDGDRYLWLLWGGSVYALSRNFCVTEIGAHPRLELADRTVLDVEHVHPSKYHWRGPPNDASPYERHDPRRNARGLAVLIDALVFLGSACTALALAERMKRVHWVLPYLQTNAMHVVPQEYVPPQHSERMHASGRMFQYCPCDGMILVRPEAPYRAGHQRDFLKWKPRIENTIDTLVEQDEHETRLLTVADNNTDYDAIVVLRPPQRELPHGAIMEMSYDAALGRWRGTRERTDKRMPNATWVARNIMATFGSEVPLEQLRALLHCNAQLGAAARAPATLFERARAAAAQHRR